MQLIDRHIFMKALAMLAVLAQALSPLFGQPKKEMKAARCILNQTEVHSYIEGYTDLIEDWQPQPSSTGYQYIYLQHPIVPLTDFTIEGTMTYVGAFEKDGAMLSLNGTSTASTAFSLWRQSAQNVIMARCWAMEMPIIESIDEDHPTFSFCIQYDSSTQTMTMARGDLQKIFIFTASLWTWKTAFALIQSGLVHLHMSQRIECSIQSLRVYPTLLTQEQLLYNHSIDIERFGLDI